ncbi:MAG: hypothetical protein KJ767_00285 [Nanoarchaeota archaeon]|nr:hypothetical protein [Nanoarchaeota archaeon]
MSKRGKIEDKISGISVPKGYEKTIRLLLENNINLQKKIVDLTISTDELNKKMSRLLSLIEKASESFSEGAPESELGTATVVNRMEELIRQNKTIARGLILLEKYVRDNVDKKEGEFKPLPEYKF